MYSQSTDKFVVLTITSKSKKKVNAETKAIFSVGATELSSLVCMSQWFR